MQLLGQHEEQSDVAFGAGGRRCALDLLRDVATVAAVLPKDQPGRDCLLCFRGDRYEFAVALFAAWQVGLRAVLPPNLQVETISGLIASPTRVALLHDTQVKGHLHVGQLLSGDKCPTSAQPLAELPRPQGVAAAVLTSGSTGENQVWQKTMEQLLGEVEAWAAFFSDGIPPRVVATVQPGHLYGLLFSVLYPLLTGGSFFREIPFSPEAVAEAVRENRANTLVTVPVHLRAARALEPGSFEALQRVISSTAPLHEADELRFRERHGVDITEIFGSTETGGIAFRRRSEHRLWKPLAEVSVTQSPAGTMIVDSPFSSHGLPRPYESADRIELFGDGRFDHLGRADNVVKIGGKRVPFLEQEAWLLQQPGVTDAAILDVPDATRGTRLLALLAGNEHHQNGLRQRMAERFGATVIPKRFVTMHRLPRGPNGKLARGTALALFKVGLDGRPLAETVEILSEEESEQTVDAGRSFSIRARVPEDFVWYKGHFQGYPVMAGVVQLHSVIMPLLRRQVPDLGEIRSMDALKFTGRICPGDEIELCATLDATACSAKVSIKKSDRVLSAGKLTFFPKESPSQGVRGPASA